MTERYLDLIFSIPEGHDGSDVFEACLDPLFEAGLDDTVISLSGGRISIMTSPERGEEVGRIALSILPAGSVLLDEVEWSA